MRVLPPRDASWAPYPPGIDDRLRKALTSRGVDQLYSHQAIAIEHALAGRNVVVTTPTASGKTLCYNAPALDAILRDPSARAMYLFPTKALAQDLAEYNIRVNCISPGQIDTSRAPGNERPSRLREIPLGRKGTSFEIAGRVRALCGPAGAYMTGQTIHINGGLSNSGV